MISLRGKCSWQKISKRLCLHATMEMGAGAEVVFRQITCCIALNWIVLLIPGFIQGNLYSTWRADRADLTSDNDSFHGMSGISYVSFGGFHALQRCIAHSVNAFKLLYWPINPPFSTQVAPRGPFRTTPSFSRECFKWPGADFRKICEGVYECLDLPRPFWELLGPRESSQNCKHSHTLPKSLRTQAGGFSWSQVDL